jgi:hypothetical protein
MPVLSVASFLPQKIPAITFNQINDFLYFPGFHQAIVFNLNHKGSCVITTIKIIFQFYYRINAVLIMAFGGFMLMPGAP